MLNNWGPRGCNSGRGSTMREEERPDRNWKFNSAERKMGSGCLYPLNAKPSPCADLAEATCKPSAMQVSLSPIHNNDEAKKKFADRWQAV
jgi:hypothetical protein